MEKKQLSRFVFGLFLMVLIASTASVYGSLTPVNPSPREVDLAEPGGVLDSLYGLDNLRRVDDYDAVVSDRYWLYNDNVDVWSATVIAKYASYTHQLGIIPKGSGGAFQAVLSDSSYRDGVINSASATTTISSSSYNDSFTLGIYVNNTSSLWSSDPAANSSSGSIFDHLVTYEIVGNEGFGDNEIGNYILAWEDLAPHQRHFDADYQDMVVEVSGIHPEEPAVPEPATMMLLALGGAYMVKRYRSV